MNTESQGRVKQGFFLRRKSLPGRHVNSPGRRVPCARIVLAAAVGLAAAGCSDEKIQTYRVPQEPLHRAAGEGPAHSQGAHAHWDTPAGWQPEPAQMARATSFRVTGPEGRLARVILLPLEGVSGIELETLNLWREELGLPRATASELNELGRSFEIDGLNAKVFDMTANEAKAGASFKPRILGAMLERKGTMWFAKMSGDEATLEREKPNFDKFLASVTFDEGSHGEMTGPVSTNAKHVPADASLPKWNVPSHWQDRAPGPMVLAAFGVSGKEGGQAEVTISKLPGDGGDLLANVNRWRGQLGLPSASPAELPSQISYLKIDGADAPQLDITGTNARTGKEARMITVAVRRPQETWFYKLMGDQSVVEQEKDTFVKFIQSAY